jgi:phospholipase C
MAAVASRINHIVVLMQENRSYDSYFGQLHYEGQPDSVAEPGTGNPDPGNPLKPPIVPFHQVTLCANADLGHSWDQSHHEYDGGAMDGFTAVNAIPDDPTGARSMGYYDQTELPFYYSLANTFGIGDHYFASVLGPTYSNRMYLLAGTSFGHITNDLPPTGGWTQPTIFDSLNAAHISWKVYAASLPFAIFFHTVSSEATTHVFPMSQYYADAKAGTLPQVAYIEPRGTGGPNTEGDEHPPANIQVGQHFVYRVVNALEGSPNWGDSAMFLTYDEHGGFYDHVASPPAPIPDNIPPMLKPGNVQATFDHYGIRVPVTVISPWARPHFVSHTINDHTSILKFIEDRFSLPPLTARDAAANDMSEFFNFSSPAFATPPKLVQPTITPCWAQDVNVSVGAGDPTQLVAGDTVSISFDEPINLSPSRPSIQLADHDGTIATVDATNATFTLDASGTVLTLSLTGAPAVSTPGRIAGVQFPATIIGAKGVNNAQGAHWDLAQSPDLILSPGANR